jgi:hypothetical protein
MADDIAEQAEGFVVRLFAPSPGLTISQASAGGRVLDDDAPASAMAASDWVL